MDGFDLFAGAVSIVLGVGVGVGASLALILAAAETGDLVRSVVAAIKRWQVRDVVVTEYYDVHDMRFVRRIDNPTPDQVVVAKKQAKKIAGKE